MESRNPARLFIGQSLIIAIAIDHGPTPLAPTHITVATSPRWRGVVLNEAGPRSEILTKPEMTISKPSVPGNDEKRAVNTDTHILPEYSSVFESCLLSGVCNGEKLGRAVVGWTG